MLNGSLKKSREEKGKGKEKGKRKGKEKGKKTKGREGSSKYNQQTELLFVPSDSDPAVNVESVEEMKGWLEYMINVVVERDVRHVDSSQPHVNMSCEAFPRRLDMVCFCMKRVSVVRRKVLMKLAATIPTLLIPTMAFDEGLHDIMSLVVLPCRWCSSWFDRLSQLSMVI